MDSRERRTGTGDSTVVTPGTTKYSNLLRSTRQRQDLKIAWQWKSQNFGKRPDFNWEVTPLAVNGILYFTRAFGAMRSP